jgi:hypothetical protein
MVFGMSLETYTLIHVAIGLIGIASGAIVLFGMLQAKQLGGSNAVFLTTTVLTSVTGFGFPNTHVTPGIVLGVLSLVVLAMAMYALYARHLAGGWRAAYVVTAGVALYFNCFVLVAQSFQKLPALHALAPTGKEAPFGIAQLLLLVIFAALITRAVKRFHPEAKQQQARAA